MSITTMVIVVMDIYLQIVHHNSVTRMMDNSFEKVLLSETESDLETLSGLEISSPEGRWRTVRKPGLDENSGFEWKNLYFLYQ